MNRFEIRISRRRPLQLLQLLPLIVLTVLCTAGWQRAKLKFETVENLTVGDTVTALRARHVQTGAEPLKIEAEAFSELELQDASRRVAASPDYSGGMALAYCRRIGYRFTVAAPGRYTMWLRARFPLVANWNHTEAMDGGETVRVVDSTALPANLWHWCESRTYDLDSGEHEWRFPAPTAWCGGCELDYAVLVPAGRKPDAAAPTGLRLPEAGYALGRRIRTARIARWRLYFEPVANGGEIAVEYSCDRRTFRPVVSGTVYTPEGDYLYIRLRIKRAPGSKISPILHNLRFEIEKKAESSGK